MIHEAKCKFCGKVLHLEIDDSYSLVTDSLKLLPLAACNRCSDLRERRRFLHERLTDVCCKLVASHDSDTVKSSRELLETLTKRYVKLISEWTHREIPWEKQMVEPFIAAPKVLGSHLKRLWSLSKQQQLGI